MKIIKIFNKFILSINVNNCQSIKLFSTSYQYLPKLPTNTTSAQPTLRFSENNNNFSSFILSSEIRQRQASLIKLIDKSLHYKNKPSLLLIPSASRLFQADTKIPELHYKQNSDFTYLTGFTNQQSAECVLVIIGGNDYPIKSYLFAPESTHDKDMWEGFNLRSDYSDWINQICDDLIDINQLDNFIAKQNSNIQIFASKYGLNNNNSGNSLEKLNGNFKKSLNLKSNNSIHPLSFYIDNLRLIKSPQEIEALRRSCRIGAEAMYDTMKYTNCNPFDDNNFNLINESQIAAYFEYKSRMNGAKKLAFPTVCGSGSKSCGIHYGLNNQFILPSEWILMDAGCEDIEGYNSDITRTWPIYGDYSNKLKSELYEALCHVQKNLILAIEQDPTISLDELFKMMCLSLGKLLIEFKVLDKYLSREEAAIRAYRYCPHHVSHYLGLDIHDTPSISRNIPLKPGMCFTVEPGLYFHKNDNDLKSEFKGFGFRVEDDLIINYDGKVEVLTRHCPHFLNL